MPTKNGTKNLTEDWVALARKIIHVHWHCIKLKSGS